MPAYNTQCASDFLTSMGCSLATAGRRPALIPDMSTPKHDERTAAFSEKYGCRDGGPDYSLPESGLDRQSRIRTERLPPDFLERGLSLIGNSRTGRGRCESGWLTFDFDGSNFDLRREWRGSPRPVFRERLNPAPGFPACPKRQNHLR